MSSSRPVGVLDSGIGGVTVMREAQRLLPNEDYIFFSDSVNNPYGDKSDEEIISRCFEIAHLLIDIRGCKALVLACNTASAKAADALRKKYKDTPVFAIEPAYKMVHDLNPEGFTLVLATRGTVNSEKFRRLYYRYYNHNTALLACVGLADLIEQDRAEELKKYLEDTLGKYRGRVQNVVLGCTHYPIAKADMREVLGDVNFFDGSLGISKRLRDILTEKELLNDGGKQGKIIFIDSSPDKEMKKQKEERFFSILNEETL